VRREPLLASLIVALALSAPVAAARADQRIVAAPPSSYATTSVTIQPGEPLTFLNLDTLGHDVTARDRGAGNQPLFRTPIIGPGQEVPVEGASALGAGSYEFFCSIPPNMIGRLTVAGTGSGGGGGGGGGGGDGGVGLKVRILDSRLGKVRRAGALRARVTVDDPATVKLSAKARAGGKGAKLGKARQELEEAGSERVKVKLSKGGRKALRGVGSAKVVLKAEAEDAGGETDTAKAAKRLSG
jgi:plastocyanin